MQISKTTPSHFQLRFLATRAATCASLVATLLLATGGTCAGGTGLPGDPNVIGAPGSNNNGNGTGSGVKPTITSSDHVIGSASATVTVIEYSDFQCPFCGKFERESYPTLKTQYIDTGKVRWVFRHFPLRTIHNRAEPCARASECAGDQVDFFAYKEAIFADQTDLSDARLSNEAVALGANKAQFDACAAGNTKATRVQQDVNTGTTFGINSTPTFMINGEKFSGFRTAAEFGALIDARL